MLPSRRRYSVSVQPGRGGGALALGYLQPVADSALLLAQQLVDAFRELARGVRRSAKLDVLALQSLYSFPASVQRCAILPIHRPDLLRPGESAPIHLMKASAPRRSRRTPAPLSPLAGLCGRDKLWAHRFSLAATGSLRALIRRSQI